MTRRGRPRLQRSASGRGTRHDILQSAAQLFAEHGFGATTRDIAESAGIRQASLYHHFANREAILLELLTATVRPSIQVATALTRRDEPATARLWALAAWDSTQLTGREVNLGGLYLLPEVQLPAFADFRRDWSELLARYAELVEQCHQSVRAAPLEPRTAAELVIGLVESAILSRRRDEQAEVGPHDVADAVVLLATGRPVSAALRRTALRVLGELPEVDEPRHTSETSPAVS